MSQWRLRHGLAVAPRRVRRPPGKKEPGALVHAHAAVTPPSATHMSATASRRPGFRAAEPLAHGRRCGAYHRDGGRVHGEGTGSIVRGSPRRAPHRAAARRRTGHWPRTRGAQCLAPVAHAACDGTTAASSSSSCRITNEWSRSWCKQFEPCTVPEFQRKHIKSEEFGTPKAT